MIMCEEFISIKGLKKKINFLPDLTFIFTPTRLQEILIFLLLFYLKIKQNALQYFEKPQFYVWTN